MMLKPTVKKNKILVAIQHQLTTDQLAELEQAFLEPVLLKNVAPELFAKAANSPEDAEAIDQLGQEIIDFIFEKNNYKYVLFPIGSPALMFRVAAGMAWRAAGVHVLFAHSERVSVEEPQPDGSIKKINVFKHVGFTQVY